MTRIGHNATRSARGGAVRAQMASAAHTLVLLALLSLDGCSTPTAQSESGASPSPQQTTGTSAGLPQSLDRAARDLADALLMRAGAARPGGSLTLVIDPFLDRVTGTETAATRTLVAQIKEQVRSHYPSVELRPYTLADIEDRPTVLLGSITGVTGSGAAAPAGGPPHSYQIRAVLAEPRSGRVLDAETALVRADDVSTTLAPFFRDSPGWLPDPAAAAYFRTVEARAGEAMDPSYLAGLPVGGLVADGMVAYESGRYREALDRYAEAQRLPAGDQMRVYNGLYLSTWALGRRREAEEAFGRVIDFGLRRERLAVKFLFRPGSAAFWPDPTINAPYGMWLRQIALRADEHAACLLLTGHASSTGFAVWNDQLSQVRAEYLRKRLVEQRPTLRERTQAQGVGAREPLIGTGADDASDVLDRRVELDPRACDELSRAD